MHQLLQFVSEARKELGAPSLGRANLDALAHWLKVPRGKDELEANGLVTAFIEAGAGVHMADLPNLRERLEKAVTAHPENSPDELVWLGDVLEVWEGCLAWFAQSTNAGKSAFA